MQPFDYTIKTKSAGQAFDEGSQRMGGLLATAAEYQKAQQIATLQQQKAEADQYKRQRFMEVAQNPSSKDVSKLLVEFPDLHEGIGKALDFMSAEEKRGTQEVSYSVLSALEKNKPEAAIEHIDRQMDAARKSNNQAAIDRLEVLRDSVMANPTGAKFGLHGILFSSMGGDKYAGAMKSLGENDRASELQPGLLEKGKAEASTAAVKAKFAESDAAIELKKKGWDIAKIQEDIKISKMNSQIAAMNAQTSRMNAGTAAQGNSLKAQENALKLQEMIDKRNDAIRGKASEVEAARFNIDNMLNTADRVLKTPKSVISSAAGPISSRIPTLSSDTSDFESLVETLGSQAFLSQLPNIKGMGQLSNTEGDKLQAALQNMSLKQSPERLVENVKEAQRLLLKVRKSVAARSGMPDTVPDTPSAAPSGNSIDALLKKYGQ